MGGQSTEIRRGTSGAVTVRRALDQRYGHQRAYAQLPVPRVPRSTGFAGHVGQNRRAGVEGGGYQIGMRVQV